MNCRINHKHQAVPAVESRKVAFPFDFETVEDMLTAAGGNVFGYSGGKLIVRIPKGAELPAGAVETEAAVFAWNAPVNSHEIRCKFADWKRKAEALRK